MTTNRRNFIRSTATAAAAVGLAGPLNAGRWVAPSDRINIGLIGARNMGFGVLQKHLDTGLVNCVGLCDVDQNVLENRAADVLKNYGQKPRLFNDFRKLLEEKDLDAVIVGTPDHWHCLPMVYACQAGKDVYVEKPMANSIEECNVMVKAASRYNRIVQVGQQQRSGPHWQQVNRLIKEGRIGKLRKVNIWGNFNYGIGQLKQPDQPVPAGVDFNFWLGPAPQRTFNPTRFHGSWRMFWDYGGGLVTDWGVHLIDMAFWAKDITTPPQTIMASGGNLSFGDYNHETFDTMSVIFKMDDFTVTWEHTAGTQKGPWNKNYGLAFVGDLGTILVNREGYQVIPEWDDRLKQPKTEAEESTQGGEHHAQHAANFIDCIKTRNKPACPPEIGRAVAVAAHAANIAIRSGAGILHWDEKTGRFTNSREANQLVVPEYRKPWELPRI
ncbi:MAG TPA: Gfo/Idh/MocA family oxidoreductase [Prolixibacteraceae bacterium]|nr:Gfo/Idh/MocA family oxidoreductase [Prolixibacteraceae bacterium]